MIELPFADPGRPTTRSPARLLLWVGRRQLGLLAAGVVFGTVWMVSQALMPYVLGQAIDDGLANGDDAALGLWVGALLGLGVIQAITGVLRHRVAVLNWLLASYRLIQVIARHVARTGPAVRSRLTTGEVVATVSNDALRAGGAFDITARLAGAITSYAVVALLLLSVSTALGLLVLVGVPVLVASLSFVIGPLQRRQREQREEVGRLTALGADTVAGLRVLRGIGGEDVFLGRYRDQSQAVRHAGVRVALPQSTLDAAQVLLPGIFVVLVTWLGARLAVTGSIEPGELVAFYGYAAFLVIPLRTSAEAVDKITRSLVGARRMVAVLDVEPAVADTTARATDPPAGALLVDTRSGAVIEPGALTCVATAEPVDAAALADRLGRFVDDPGVTLGGVRLVDLGLNTVRHRILVSETDPMLFSGTLRSELDPWGDADDERILAAVATADGQDILAALPAGLDERIEERGRGFSGGQRQRLALARTLVADPEVLVLVEPTSAVDAHTEARIARRLRRAREGRTTVVMSSSPLVLDQADRVLFLDGGRVVATGRHRELLDTVPAYRDTVTRGEEE